MVAPSGTIIVKKSNGEDWLEEPLDPTDIGAAFESDLLNVSGTVNQNTADISSNSSSITTVSGLTDNNAANIALNSANISTVSGITDTNASGIAENAASIVTMSGWADNTFVEKGGDTMTGFLTLNDDPVDDLHAVPKRYLTVQSGVTLIDATLSGTGQTKVVGGPLEMKSHDLYNGSQYSFETVSGTTTTDTPLTIHTIAMPANSCLFIEADIMANRDQAVTYAIAYNAAKAVYYRNLTAAPIRVGSIDSFNRSTGTGANGYNVNLVIVGNTVEVQVDGATDHIVYWTGLVRHQILVTGA